MIKIRSKSKAKFPLSKASIVYGIPCKILIDYGPQISCISQNFYHCIK